MDKSSDIEDLLSGSLPDLPGEVITYLAWLLDQVTRQEINESTLSEYISADKSLRDAVLLLANKQFTVNHAVVSFAKDSQAGDIAANDIGGRDIIKPTINIYYNLQQEKNNMQEKGIRRKLGITLGNHYVAIALAFGLLLIVISAHFFSIPTEYSSPLPQISLQQVSQTTDTLVIQNAISETLRIDTHFKQTDTENIGPVASGTVLVAGQRYRIVISGTWSAWDATWWTAICKGRPETEPQYPSSNTVNGNVGIDAAYIFARPARSAYCGQQETLPTPNSNKIPLLISLDNTQKWTPLRPDIESFQIDHVYVYTVTGRGDVARFMINDNTVKENYGVLIVKIRGPILE